MTTRTKKISALVDHVAAECALAGIRFELRNTETVVDRRTVGFFSESDRELVVAAKDADFIHTVSHEFCHMKQWKEKLFSCEEEYFALENWLKGGTSLALSDVLQYTRMVQECELDCEKRSMRLLETFGLLKTSEKKKFVRQANAYVLCFEIARQKERWPVAGRTPMEKEEIWALLPTKFIKDVGRVPDDFLAAVLEQCY